MHILPLRVTIHCPPDSYGATQLQVRMARLLAVEGYDVECVETRNRHANTPKKWEKSVGSCYKKNKVSIQRQKVTIDIDKPRLQLDTRLLSWASNNS